MFYLFIEKSGQICEIEVFQKYICVSKVSFQIMNMIKRKRNVFCGFGDIELFRVFLSSINSCFQEIVCFGFFLVNKRSFVFLFILFCLVVYEIFLFDLNLGVIEYFLVFIF